MTDYERDLWRWKNDQSKQGDFDPEPDRNDYDEYGYKKGSVVYENGFILDPYLITLYGKEYALKYPLGKYDKEKLEEKSIMTKQEETIKRQEQTSEAAHEYVNSDAVKPENMKLAYGDFINGAKWAFEYMERNRLTACDNMTEEEAEREQRFAINFLKENDRIPTFSDAIEITRKEIINRIEDKLDFYCDRPSEFYGAIERMVKELKGK